MISFSLDIHVWQFISHYQFYLDDVLFEPHGTSRSIIKDGIKSSHKGLVSLASSYSSRFSEASNIIFFHA